MPEIVLRREGSLPYIVDVPVGSYVSPDLRDAGWSIDSDTSPDEARAEVAEATEAAVVKARDDAADFVPEFPPAPDAPADAAPVSTPAPTPTPSPEPVDTTKEN